LRLFTFSFCLRFSFMISLTCTNCQTTLSIDDAFAGGVCRCQHCGTIQTVPVRLKRREMPGSAAPVSAAKGATAETPNSNRARTESGTGAGVEDLADAVSGSGLAGTGLGGSGVTRAARAASPTITPPPRSKRKRLLIAAAGVIVVLIVVIIWLTTIGG
jgi:hypothetical protein